MKRLLRGSLVLRFAGIAMLASAFSAVKVQAASQLMDYFTPTPIVGSLSSTCWGAAQVGPRDQSNGLEDKTLAKWVYWDGGILKAPDGTYHLFCSRWDQSAGHNGWMGMSYAIHATSKNLYGPYTDLGTFYTFDGGKGHNVTPFIIGDGQYGVSISGVRPARVFTASSLDGPWTDKGDLVANGLCTQCNLKIMHRPDGKFMAVTSNGTIGYSSTLMGPYNTQGPSVYSNASNIPDKSKLEDPSIWYSGGKYHCLTNEWDIKKAFHFTSLDGMTNWKQDQGYAYDPTSNFIRYTDSTINHWCKLERPEVYMEDGHVVAFTFAAINVEKENDAGNDKNGSKVIVVPFDGATFDSDTLMVTFYPGNDYSGTLVTLKPGNYTTAQLTSAGISNNSVSSIKVPNGLSVEIYNGDNFTGTKWTINSDSPNLSSVGCNDSMSSVKIMKKTTDIKVGYDVKKSQLIVNSTIMIPGLGTFKVDNASDYQKVQFTNILGKKVMEMPVISGRTIQKCNLPYGFYIMNFYGKEKIRSRSYEVFVR
jgi:hypothetical protein